MINASLADDFLYLRQNNCEKGCKIFIRFYFTPETFWAYMGHNYETYGQ